MYLNEESWHAQQENSYVIDEKIRNFLDIYALIKRKNPRKEIFVSEDEEIYLKAEKYPLKKWLFDTDIEYRRLYLSFWNKRITFKPEDEYEVNVGNVVLKGGTEAYLNDSFMISIGLDPKWEKKDITATLVSVYEEEQQIEIYNVYCKDQLDEERVKQIFYDEKTDIVKSYEDLWKQKEELFPHLCFCPSVKDNLNKLEIFYLGQIVKKLFELEDYCVNLGHENFNPSRLTKTTPESTTTLAQYEKEHTFTDEKGVKYLANWHMRFTGIPGRIFFIPQYEKEKFLICYIGKKLKNVSYPT